MHTVGLHAAGLSQTQQKNFSSVPHRRPGVAANRYHPQTTTQVRRKKIIHHASTIFKAT